MRSGGMTTPLVQAPTAVYWALMHWNNRDKAFTCLVFGALRCVAVFFPSLFKCISAPVFMLYAHLQAHCDYKRHV